MQYLGYKASILVELGAGLVGEWHLLCKAQRKHGRRYYIYLVALSCLRLYYVHVFVALYIITSILDKETNLCQQTPFLEPFEHDRQCMSFRFWASPVQIPMCTHASVSIQSVSIQCHFLGPRFPTSSCMIESPVTSSVAVMQQLAYRNYSKATLSGETLSLSRHLHASSRSAWWSLLPYPPAWAGMELLHWPPHCRVLRVHCLVLVCARTSLPDARGTFWSPWCP